MVLQPSPYQRQCLGPRSQRHAGRGSRQGQRQARLPARRVMQVARQSRRIFMANSRVLGGWFPAFPGGGYLSMALPVPKAKSCIITTYKHIVPHPSGRIPQVVAKSRGGTGSSPNPASLVEGSRPSRTHAMSKASWTSPGALENLRDPAKKCWIPVGVWAHRAGASQVEVDLKGGCLIKGEAAA